LTRARPSGRKIRLTGGTLGRPVRSGAMRRVIWILVGLAVVIVVALMVVTPGGMSPLSFLPAG